MFHRLRRHPFPVVAHFDHCLVLTYAVHAPVLRPLLPAGLELDTFGPSHEFGFVAIALVQTRGLRPLGFPTWLGRDFFLSGYRIFTRFRTPDGERLRGLRILRSDTNRRSMVLAGNALTHYHYRLANVDFSARESQITVQIQTPSAEADLDVVAHLSDNDAELPIGSCFSTATEARRFAGPLPYTFDYERETHSIISIRGRRQTWHPRLTNVEVRKATFLDQSPFVEGQPTLSSAFYLAKIPYRWERGVRYALDGPIS